MPRLPRLSHGLLQLAEYVAAAVRRRFRVSAIVPGFLPDGSAGRSSVMNFRSVADASAAADWCYFFGPITQTQQESRSSYYIDRKSTRLNQSLMRLSYAVLCFKKKNKETDKDIANSTQRYTTSN